MFPPVCIASSVDFLVTCCFWLLRGMARQIVLEGFNLLPYLSDSILYCFHGRVLGGHAIFIFRHLCRQVHVGASEVSHCRPFLRCFLCKVCEIFLYSDQVVGSVAALARGLLPLSEVLFLLSEVGLEGFTGFLS